MFELEALEEIKQFERNPGCNGLLPINAVGGSGRLLTLCRHLGTNPNLDERMADLALAGRNQ